MIRKRIYFHLNFNPEMIQILASKTKYQFEDLPFSTGGA